MRMLPLFTLLLLAMACQDNLVLQPLQTEAAQESLVPFTVDLDSHGPVVMKANGSGHTWTGADNLLRSFSFSALKHADGYVTGQFQLNNRAKDVAAQGSVTCLVIVGNQAWVGGVVEQVRAGESTSIAVGQARAWLAIDNGEGAADEPDRISGFRILENCETQPPWFTNAVETGNIQVMGMR